MIPRFFLMIMSAIPVSITREPVGQRRGRIRVAVNLSYMKRVYKRVTGWEGQLWIP